MKDFWNQRYAEPDYAYGRDPNAFFAETLAGLTPGRLLLPAEGEGRNAVHAAAQGWDVHAFDYSASGRDKALRLAAERGLTIRYDLATFEDAAWSPGSYDALALIFAHVHQSARRALHRRLVTALRPGGTLIIDAFTKEQLARDTGGPRSLEHLYDPDELRADFVDLDIVHFEVAEAELREGPYHHGLASVVRLVARTR